jgi:hypothetical protein
MEVSDAARRIVTAAAAFVPLLLTAAAIYDHPTGSSD